MKLLPLKLSTVVATLFMHSHVLCRLDTFEVIVQIGLIMGQLITRFTRGVEKRDINLEYQTPGDGDAIDGNDEYQPSDNDEVEERNDGVQFRPP